MRNEKRHTESSSMCRSPSHCLTAAPLHCSYGLVTFTVGVLTSVFLVPTTGLATMIVSFLVPTTGVLMVSVLVPTSTLGVVTVCVSVPMVGVCTWYWLSPVFLQAAM